MKRDFARIRVSAYDPSRKLSRSAPESSDDATAYCYCRRGTHALSRDFIFPSRRGSHVLMGATRIIVYVVTLTSTRPPADRRLREIPLRNSVLIEIASWREVQRIQLLRETILFVASIFKRAGPRDKATD